MKKAALVVVLALAAASSGCADRPYQGAGLSGASPANFYYKSDALNAQALLTAVDAGTASTWKVSDDSFGAVTPVAARYQDAAGRPCQGLKHERDGIARSVAACKDQAGVWVVSEWIPDPK